MLNALAPAVASAPFAAGERLFVAGEECMCAALLLSGSACELRGTELAMRAAGEFVGEDGALLPPFPVPFHSLSGMRARLSSRALSIRAHRWT